MIASMTGFASKTQESEYGVLTWEIRSVNHRFLEISMRLPDTFRQLEMKVRQHISQSIKRGKIDAYLKFTPGLEMPFDLIVNESLLQQLTKAVKVVEKQFPNGNINHIDLLGWPGVLDKKQTHMDELMQSALHLLGENISQLCAMRLREGKGLKKFIHDRLVMMHREIKTIESRSPILQAQAREKIYNRFSELSLKLESDRLEQELVLLLQKMDVAEEIQRLYAHIDETNRILNEGEVIGRRLDFLMQEFNREANTLGSKSSDPAVARAVIELKVQIEQIREQVQNIE